jgi:hypothetical protein
LPQKQIGNLGMGARFISNESTAIKSKSANIARVKQLLSLRKEKGEVKSHVD